MFSSKAGTEWSLLEGIIDGDLGFDGGFAGEPNGPSNLGEKEDLGRVVKDFFPRSLTNEANVRVE